MQNRALKTLQNDGDFCYGHTLCPPDGAQLSNVCEFQKHERALFYWNIDTTFMKTYVRKCWSTWTLLVEEWPWKTGLTLNDMVLWRWLVLNNDMVYHDPHLYLI